MGEVITNWRIEPRQEANKTLLYIYDDVSDYGTFDWTTWTYKESETSAKYFRDQMAAIPEGQEIELHINSNGGSVKEGTAIYNILRQKGNHKTGIVDGVAHSVAFLILQACDVRKMCLGTTALIHNMWMSCYGNAAQLRKYADDLDDMMEANRQIFLARATISEEELSQLMEKETYLTPDKALEYGLIDEVMKDIVNQPDPKDLLQKLSDMQRQLNAQQSFREQIAAMKQQEQPQGQTTPKPKEPEAGNTLMNMFKGIARKGKEE
ncbi:MAG: Clp protease ClpP [Eubacteriales bacterium]|nr:Clp protease ClpP [Eubacteriales bacterium]